jgi:hypothetical protein
VCRQYAHNKGKGKAISATGHEGAQGCEMLRFSYFLDKKLRDGSEVVSHIAALYSTTKIPNTHFC